MGVLEDAIREHLELKRKHGASDEEVERKELEALGPARREFEGAAEETPADELDAAEPEAAGPLADEHAVLEPEPPPDPLPKPDDEPEVAEQPPLEPPPLEPDIAEPATTRLHEPPPVQADFDADDDEEAADERSQRDWDFD